MPVPSSMDDLSTTASSNSPAGSENPATTDDYHRAIQAVLRSTNAKGTDIASAGTINLGAATGEFVDVTGTTTITSLGTVSAGIVRTVRFTGALTLTHNATSLVLPTGANITTASNDVAIFRSLGGGNWVCVSYVKQDGSPLALPSSAVTLTGTQALTNKTLTSPIITASTATVATDDKVLLLDTDDSDNTKTVTAQSIADLASGITIGTEQNTTSGTTIGEAIGANTKRVTVVLTNVSFSGAGTLNFTVDENSSEVTTGYTVVGGQFAGSSGSTSATNSFIFATSISSASTCSGVAVFTRKHASSNHWAFSFQGNIATGIHFGTGYIELTNALTDINFNTTATAFDSGKVVFIQE